MRTFALIFGYYSKLIDYIFDFRQTKRLSPDGLARSVRKGIFPYLHQSGIFCCRGNINLTTKSQEKTKTSKHVHLFYIAQGYQKLLPVVFRIYTVIILRPK